MYRIAIVEDQASDVQRLQSALYQYGQEKQVTFECKH